MIKILINDNFKKFLLQQSPDFRRKVHQKFEYLEIGYWDGGLKVKKIKSIGGNRALFEARLDRSNRILFTLGQENHGNHSDHHLLIYVWGVVSHDDVSHHSKHIPKNVPFLHFKAYREETLTDFSLENLESAYHTQESITQKPKDDSPTQQWHFLDEESWQRITDYREEDFELALYLTPRQQEILQKPLPLLISGTAGSGKTTLSIYYLLKLSLAKEKKLFITYNQFLRNSAYQLYGALLNASPYREEFVFPDFYTFKEYCLTVAEAYGKKFPIENEINFERFNKLIRTNNQARKFDAPLTWEEIRSIIKGALPQLDLQILQKALVAVEKKQLSPTLLNSLQQQLLTISQLKSLSHLNKFTHKYLNTDLVTLSKEIQHFIKNQPDRFLSSLEHIIHALQKKRDVTGKKYLSYMDYEALSLKKAPNFPVDRKAIYGIFEWYQNLLEQEKRWDELDLTREVLKLLMRRDSDLHRYDLVACDEIQDLTDVQHQLLFFITRNPLHLLLSGDTKQIINPSGFRWEELKRHFYEREMKIPEIHFLNLNFRSSGSIVELSNLLLDLKSRLLGTRSEELIEDWKYKGRPPVVIKNLSEPEVLKSVQYTGARKTILVRSDTEKEQLKEILGTELIFTINEAKGLEFDTVLLWKFAADMTCQDIWKHILEYTDREVHIAHIRNEINLLYVALTRARKELLIYDGKHPSLIWSSEEIKDKLYLTDDLEYIEHVWDVPSTPKEWKEQGDYFFEREFYKAARECYKNAGENGLAKKAEAFQAEKSGDFAVAAPLFEQIGELEKAARYYEQSGKYEQACQTWTTLKQKDEAQRCYLLFLEKEKRYQEAGELYLSGKAYAKAVEFFARSGDYEQAARITLKHLQDKERAACYFEEAGQFDNAARLFQKLNRLEKAADLYERARNYKAASRLWKKLKREDRLIRLYQRTNNYPALLTLYEKMKDFDRAVKTLKKFGNKKELADEAQHLLHNRKYFPALIRFSILQDHPNIALCFHRLKDFARAGRHYELAGLYYHAGLAYRKAKQYKEAFINFLLSPEDEQKQFANAKRLHIHLDMDQLEDFAQELVDKQEFAKAAICFYWIPDFLHAGIYALESGQEEQALVYWKKGINTFDIFVELVAKHCLAKNQLTVGAKFILNIPSSYFESNFYRFKIQTGRYENILALMDAYFESHPNRNEMLTWVDLLDFFPIYDDRVISTRLKYLEEAEDFNRYFEVVKWVSTYSDAPVLDELSEEYEKSYEQLRTEVSEVAAIKLYMIEKYDDFFRIVQQLPLKENNCELFIGTERENEAMELMVQAGKINQVQQILINKKEYIKLAKMLESNDDLPGAARYYRVGKDYEKAGKLFEKLGKYSKAGDVYFEAKEYRKALAMYQKSGKGKVKIAKTFEQLGEYANAAKIWQELGKKKKAQQCLQMLQEPSFLP